MKRLYFIAGILCVFLTVNCTKAIIDEVEGPITTDPVTYDGDIQEIMFNNCITCHSGTAPAAGLDLSTYQNVRFSAENGNLLGRIVNSVNPMPPAGLLPATLRSQIEKWAQDDYPKN